MNKTASRIQLSWNVLESKALNEDQKVRVRRRLASRIAADGTLTVAVSDTRSQHRNRELAEERIDDVVRRALVVPKKRKATRPTKAAREGRLRAKREHSLKKRERRSKGDE